MYENGVKCSGYARKQLNRKRIQQRFANALKNSSYYSTLLYEQRREEELSMSFWHHKRVKHYQWYEAYWRSFNKYSPWERFEHKNRLRKTRHERIQLEDYLPD